MKYNPEFLEYKEIFNQSELNTLGKIDSHLK